MYDNSYMLNLLEIGMNELILVMIALIVIVGGVLTINMLDIQQANAHQCPRGYHWYADLQTCSPN